VHGTNTIIVEHLIFMIILKLWISI